MNRNWEDNVEYLQLRRRPSIWLAQNRLDGMWVGWTFTRWGVRRKMWRYVNGLAV